MTDIYSLLYATFDCMNNLIIQLIFSNNLTHANKSIFIITTIVLIKNRWCRQFSSSTCPHSLSSLNSSATVWLEVKQQPEKWKDSQEYDAYHFSSRLTLCVCVCVCAHVCACVTLYSVEVFPRRCSYMWVLKCVCNQVWEHDSGRLRWERRDNWSRWRMKVESLARQVMVGVEVL